MPQIVLIREISPTLLHLSTRREAFCLRDYSRGPNFEPKVVMRQRPSEGITTSTIRAKARQAGNLLLPAPGDVRWEDAKFWHHHIEKLKDEHLGVSPPIPPAGGETASISIEIKSAGITVGVLKTVRTGLIWMQRGQPSGHRLTWQQLEDLARDHGESVGP